MENFKTLKDHVYDYIAQQIRVGGLLPGQRVNENTICQAMNISRTPVREALIHLAAEGVLENQARKGFTIKSLTEQDISEIYAVIGVLDGYAASLSVDALSQQDLSDMAFYIDTMDLAIKNGNYEMYYKQQVTFHQVYIDKCGNHALIDAIGSAKNKLLRKSYDDSEDTQTKDVLYATNEEHRKILEMFKAKDKAGLFTFLSQTHWTPAYASYDVLA